VTEKLQHLKALAPESVPKSRHCLPPPLNELLRAEADGVHHIHSSNSKQPFVLEETVWILPFTDRIRISLLCYDWHGSDLK
jgi:hypothetical protein